LSLIDLKERTKFVTPIMEIMEALADSNDSPYIKGEYFGYAVNRIVKKFLGDPTYTQTAFNSTFFNENKKKALIQAADSIAAFINRTDPINTSPELYYALASIYYGFMGHAKGFKRAEFGMEVYLAGIIDKITSSIESTNTGSQKDMAMMFRRHLIVRGVLLRLTDGHHDINFWNDEGSLIHGEQEAIE
jgi:hypothetical protein